MKEVKIYTIVSDQLSPPITGESFCTDMVRHSDYAELEDKYAALAADNDKAMESLKQADAVVKLAHEKFSALAAENAVKQEFIKNCFRVAADGASMDGADILELGERLSLFRRETYQPVLHGYICGREAGEGAVCVMMAPATDAFLAEVRAKAHKEGAYFVANRMLAAWDAGFIDDTAKNAADIARMILTSTEFMADAPEGDFDRSFADGVLEGIAAQLRKGVQS
ncbi:TPA_asm: Eae-like protein [Salmonella enterica subsp. enterica]|nr:Eae-like protein [Salmonella enterica subsp. enterica]HAB6312378.1 Eae-like protein [Salmonella enterica subsp. enterica]